MDILKEVLDRLDTFNVVAMGLENKESLHFDNGMKVSYRIKTLSVNQHDMTFQAVLRVSLDDGFPFTWGCTSEEDNRLMVTWFSRHRAKAWEIDYNNKTDKLDELNKILS